MEKNILKKATNAKARKRGFLSRFRRDEKGVAALEFALLSPFILVIIILFTEMSVNFLFQRMLANATTDVERMIKTQQVTSTTSLEEFVDDVLCDLPGLRPGASMFNCQNILVDVVQVAEFDTPQNPERDEEGNLDTSTFDFSPGASGTLNILRLYYEVPSPTGFTNLVGLGDATTSDDKQLIGAVAAFLIEP